MKQPLDKILLLCYCALSFIFISIDVGSVASLLFGIAISSANYFFQKKHSTFWSMLFYIAISYFFPIVVIVFPLIFYDILKRKQYVLLPFGLISYFLFFLKEPSIFFLFSLVGIFLSFILYYQTTSYEHLFSLFHKTRDDGIEHNFLLTEKNLALLEKQDYEIYTATLKERNRIAREIHDNVGHLLSRSILMTGALKAMNKESSLENPLIELEKSLSSAMNSIRDSVHDLHDDSINLREVMFDLTTQFDFAPVDLQYDMLIDIPKEIKYSFIAITKEALTNIQKHSNATKVLIIMREHPGLYQLSIKDNGTNIHLNSSGMGLSNMKDRIHTLKGNLQIQTDQGFHIFITVSK